MARGLMPVRTQSAHWLAHPQFARAIDDFLEREGAGDRRLPDELDDRSPFKADGADGPRRAASLRPRGSPPDCVVGRRCRGGSPRAPRPGLPSP